MTAYVLEQDEVWKEIFGYEGMYEISNLGNARSVKRLITYSDGRKGLWDAKNLKKINTAEGYIKYRLCKNGKCKSIFAHRIVLKSFKQNINNYPVVNHLDSNRSNNNLSNLEWCTYSRNQQHSYDSGNRKKAYLGTKHNNKRSIVQKDKNGNPLKIWNINMNVD